MLVYAACACNRPRGVMYSREDTPTAVAATWRECSKDMSLAKFSTIFRRGVRKKAHKGFGFLPCTRVSHYSSSTYTHIHARALSVYILVSHRTLPALFSHIVRMYNGRCSWPRWTINQIRVVNENCTRKRPQSACSRSCERRAEKYTHTRASAYTLCVCVCVCVRGRKSRV